MNGVGNVLSRCLVLFFETVVLFLPCNSEVLILLFCFPLCLTGRCSLGNRVPAGYGKLEGSGEEPECKSRLVTIFLVPRPITITYFLVPRPLTTTVIILK